MNNSLLLYGLLAVYAGLLGATRGTEAFGLLTVIAVGVAAVTLICLTLPSKPIRAALIISLILRMGLALGHTYLHPLPDSSLDAVDFEETGWQVARFFSQRNAVLPDVSGAELYSLLIGLLYYLFERTPVLPQMINVLLGVANVYLLSQITLELSGSQRAAVAAAVIAAFFPTSNLYSALIMRENLIVFFTALSLYTMLLWLKERRLSLLFSSSINLLGAAALHGGMIVLGAPYALVFVLVVLREKGVSSRKLWQLLLGICVFTLSLYIFNTALSNKVPEDASTLLRGDFLARQAETAARDRAAYLVGLQPSGPGAIIVQTPVRIGFFWLSPFPWMVSSAKDLLGLLDSLLYLVLLAFGLRGYKSLLQQKERAALLLLVFLAFSLTFGWGTSNYGAAIRHRHKLIAVMVPLAATGAVGWRLAGRLGSKGSGADAGVTSISGLIH
ncbi:MAG TPA: glycosyltransferase family 39 protein [Bacillota bacterium]|nr:glycosyltransferase family 39 protein [Bacillota bacterium]